MEQQTVISSRELPKEVIGALADAFGKSISTIERWVKTDSLMLTTDTAKGVFNSKGFEYRSNKAA